MNNLYSKNVKNLDLELQKFMITRKTPGFARLCSQSRFRFVGVSRLFFDKLVMSRFHRQVAMSNLLSKTERLLRQIAQPFSEDNSYVAI